MRGRAESTRAFGHDARDGTGDDIRGRGRAAEPRPARRSAARGRAGGGRRSCFGSTASSVRGSSPAPTRPGAARSPGRWSPPAVLIDYERLSLRDRRALSDLDDSKVRSPRSARSSIRCVMRAAARVAVTVRCVRGIDARGLHVTNLAALARSLERVAVPGRRLPHRRILGCRSCSVEHRAVIDGDARAPRSPPPR